MARTPPCAPTISASAPAATTSSRSSRRSAVAAPSSVSTADRSKARCTAGGRARRRTLCHEAKHCRKRSCPLKRSAARPSRRSTRSTWKPGSWASVTRAESIGEPGGAGQRACHPSRPRACPTTRGHVAGSPVVNVAAVREPLHDSETRPSSAWSPLAHPVFRALWLASCVSNVGTWMHDTSAAWLMTGLAPSPLMVSLMQTATSLPFFLLALPAGALADIVDRRRLLLVTQAWMLVAAAALGVCTVLGRTGPWLLLSLTFCMGLGNALNAPAWQATTPDLVPREELAGAVALGGISVNVARALGPALGGLLVAALGAGWVFLLNAASFLRVVLVLARWHREVSRSRLPPEDVPGAMRAGVRYVRHSAPFRAVLARTAAFVVPASALWALLPLFARRGLELSATGYGLLLGCLGAGAIVGAAFLPRVHERLTSDRLVLAGTAVFAAVSAVVALARVPLIAGGGLFIGGVAWMGAMSTLSGPAPNP